jgi:hypothetical protein
MVGRMPLGLSFRSVAALSIVLSAATAAKANPITDVLEGEWSGSGQVVYSNGTTERIRCRGTAHSSTENSIDQNFDCATAGKAFGYSSALHFSEGRVRGTWRSGTRSGRVLGDASRSRINARLISDQGDGSLSASMSGCSQSLSVSGWDEGIKSLSVRLKKDGCT